MMTTPQFTLDPGENFRNHPDGNVVIVADFLCLFANHSNRFGDAMTCEGEDGWMVNVSTGERRKGKASIDVAWLVRNEHGWTVGANTLRTTKAEDLGLIGFCCRHDIRLEWGTHPLGADDQDDELEPES